MKLYTEEAVIISISKARLMISIADSLHYKYRVEDILESLTPIELPSDEDVKQHLTNKHSKALNPPSVYYRIGFKAGIKWMKEQILNQNK